MEISDHSSNLQITKSIVSDIISSLSNNMLSYGLGFMLLHNTHSPLSFGLDIAIEPIIDFLFFIPIGNYVDHHNHKKVLTINYICRLILLPLFIMFLPLFSKSQQLIPVAIFIALSEIFSNISTATYSASVHELVNQHKITTLNSYEQACSASAELFAPILGVILYSLVSINYFITIEFVAVTLAFIIMLTMRFFKQESFSTRQIKGHHQLQDFRTTINYIRQRNFIKDLMLTASIINLLFAILSIGPSYMIVDRLHLPNTVISFIDSGLILGIIIGSLSSNLFFKRIKLFYKLLGPILLNGIGIAALGIVFNYAKTFWTVTVFGSLIAFMIGLSVATINVSLSVRIQSTIPTKLLGRVESAITAINTVFMPVGAILFSFLLKINHQDVDIFILSGASLVIYTLLFAKKAFKDIQHDNKFIAKHKIN